MNFRPSAAPSPRDSRRTIRSLALGLVLTAAATWFPPSAQGFHDWRDPVHCTDCHLGLPLEVRSPADLRFQPTIHETCGSCHQDAHTGARFSHPVVATPGTTHIPRDMPADAQGRLNCMTCHVYHPSNATADSSLLRRPASGRYFCLYCHSDLP